MKFSMVILYIMIIVLAVIVAQLEYQFKKHSSNHDH